MANINSTLGAVRDKKKDVFTKIGAYTSLMQSGTLPDETNIFPSINNKKDIVPYLLDLLKVIVGSNALQDLTGELFTKFISVVEPQLKLAVKKQTIQYNSGDPIPAYFSSGISVPVKNIDVFGKLKTNPQSTSGSMIYSDNVDTFDNKLYEAIRNAGTDTVFGNLIVNYNGSTDSFLFKPTTTSGNIGEWMGDFVDNAEIINKKQFMSEVMNAFYGSISKDQKKTVEQVYQELEINKLIEQLINDDDSFEISPEDYEELLKRAQEIVNGVVYYDMGCGVMAASLPLSGLSSLISSISGSTDPFYIGNQINNTIDESTADTPEVADANKQTVKDGFFQRIIKLIQQMLANAVSTQPLIRTILAISSAFVNNGVVQISTPLNDLKKFKVYLKCIIRDAMKELNKYIFKLVVGFLIALLNPVVRKIIREKINQYIGILKSLIPIGKFLD